LITPLDMGVHFGLEKSNGRPAVSFGTIKRAISTSDKVLRVRSVIRSYGDSNSYTDIHYRIVDLEWLTDRRRDASCQICRIIRGFDLWHDDTKLITSDSGKQGITTEDGGNPLGELDQSLIADAMTVQIVDHLEAVKIEHENGQPLRIAGSANAVVEFLGEEAAVGKSGQRVVAGQIAGLQLGASPCFDFAREILIATKPIDYQSDAGHNAHYNKVVDLPTRVIQRKLEYSRRKIVVISESKGDRSDAEKDNHISYIASPQQTDHDVTTGLE
jgi:hypothetical protein